MNRVVVKIQGSEYNIVSSKNPEQMKIVAKYVDDEMKKVKEGNPKLNSVTTSIVACLNIADILFDCSHENEELHNELETLKQGMSQPSEEFKAEVENISSELEQKELDIIEKDYLIEELSNKLKEKEKEIESLNKLNEEIKIELQNHKSELDGLKSEAIDAAERARIAENMSCEWQNRTYDLQLKYTDLENKLKNREGTL